jgi:hypothetical protein
MTNVATMKGEAFRPLRFMFVSILNSSVSNSGDEDTEEEEKKNH